MVTEISGEEAMAKSSDFKVEFPTPIVAIWIPLLLISCATSVPLGLPPSRPSVIRNMSRGSFAVMIKFSHARRPDARFVPPPRC